MATSEICIEDSIRKDYMKKFANDESCYLLAKSERGKEAKEKHFSYATPCSFEQARPTNLSRGNFPKVAHKLIKSCPNYMKLVIRYLL